MWPSEWYSEWNLKFLKTFTQLAQYKGICDTYKQFKRSIKSQISVEKSV